MKEKMEIFNQIIKGDCLDVIDKIPNNSIDLVYLDPPFFTQKIQKLSTKDRKQKYCFSDIWDSTEKYTDYLVKRLEIIYPKIKETGSLFFHIDRNAAHIVRFILDALFGSDCFQSEIIWTFKRWSNSKNGLLSAHQNIFFYSKTNNFKFNKIYTDYSYTTNIDQILQNRKRDEFGKSIYDNDENGNIKFNLDKKGVPLSDVWDIPFLNPKANERVGYPTQKPIILLRKIIELVTNKGDLVVDPFCGSGTTLVAAKLLNRDYIGIDISDDAVELAKSRIANPLETHSNLLEKGIEQYNNSHRGLDYYLEGIEYTPVQRNTGIDAILKTPYNNTPITVKIQRSNESLSEAMGSLYNSSKSKKAKLMFLVVTKEDVYDKMGLIIPKEIRIINSSNLEIKSIIESFGIKSSS